MGTIPLTGAWFSSQEQKRVVSLQLCIDLSGGVRNNSTFFAKPCACFPLGEEEMRVSSAAVVAVSPGKQCCYFSP